MIDTETVALCGRNVWVTASEHQPWQTRTQSLWLEQIKARGVLLEV